jgi:hypothetical protein
VWTELADASATDRGMPMITAKVIGDDIFRGFPIIGGYQSDNEICVVASKHVDMEYPTKEVVENALHEITHYVRGDSDRTEFNGGHDSYFYRDLFERCLKYGIEPTYFIEDEHSYMGDVVFEGINLFHKQYNEGPVKKKWHERMWNRLCLAIF